MLYKNKERKHKLDTNYEYLWASRKCAIRYSTHTKLMQKNFDLRKSVLGGERSLRRDRPKTECSTFWAYQSNLF